jgi:hypothetical protein
MSVQLDTNILTRLASRPTRPTASRGRPSPSSTRLGETSAWCRRTCTSSGQSRAAARSAGYPGSGSGRAGPAADGPAGERWPTPRLRRAVARAATGAQADGRPVSPRDLWHALLTDPDAECRAVLDALGVPAVGGAGSLAGG